MKHKIFRSLFVLMLMLGLAMTGAPQTVQAATTLTVTINTDSGPGSLRQAILDAGDGDTIVFDANYIITLQSQLPIISGKAITITGNGPLNTIIEASSCDPVTLPNGCTPANYRIFEVNNTGSLTLDGVTVRHSYCVSCDYGGGGILLNEGTLTITNSTFSDNVSSYGGAITCFQGTTTITQSIFASNIAYYSGGGVFGGPFCDIMATNSVFSDNGATYLGGGVYGKITAANVIFSDNWTASYGGGLSASGGTITNSTFSGNGAGFGGGGIDNSGDLTISNSTFYGNSAGNDGGGIYNGRTLTILNSTLSNNSSSNRGGGVANFYALHMANTIIANSTSSGGDCDQAGSGTIGMNINNLIEDGSCSASMSGDPVLGALQDNGGSTPTMALLAGSPAIDAGDDTICAASPVNNLDQRGVARPQGGTCDIGAFELETVDSTIEASIDIKPGSDTNPINTKSRGTTPVAILSTTDFDATTVVDQTSLTFGVTGDEASLAFCDDEAQDANGDGLLDLVCHFHTQQTGFQLGDSEGILKGQTIDGTALEGSDLITILNTGHVKFNVCPFDPIMITLSSPDPVWVPVQITTSGQDLNFGADDPPGVYWAATSLDGTRLIAGGPDDHFHLTWGPYNFSDPGSYYVVFSHSEAGSIYPTIRINLACDVEAPEP